MIIRNILKIFNAYPKMPSKWLYDYWANSCSFIPASPRLRPLAAPASVESVGEALCLKIHFFLRDAILRLVAQKFIEAWQFLIEIRNKKTTLLYWGSPNSTEAWQFLIEIGDKKITLLYWGSSKFFHVRTLFAEIGDKKITFLYCFYFFM